MRAYLEIKVGRHVTMEDLKPEMEKEGAVLDVDFGPVMVQIKNKEKTWHVTNAMNGYGINCFEEYKDKQVIVKQINN